MTLKHAGPIYDYILFVKCAFVAVKNKQKSQCQAQDTVSKGDIR